MRRLAIFIALIALVAAACGDSADTTTTTEPVATSTSAPGSTTSAPSTTAPDVTTSTVPVESTTTAPPETTTSAPATTTTLPATTTTTDPFGTTTTFAIDLPEGVFLSGDGLGVFDFGADAEDVIEALIDALGPPLDDSGWSDAGDSSCAGSVVRFVIWDPIFVLMTDAATPYAAEGTRHFAFWASFDVSPLATASGFVAQQTTLAEIEAVLGPVEPEFNELFDLWVFTPDSGPEAGIQFELIDESDPDQVLEAMSAGKDDVCGD